MRWPWRQTQAAGASRAEMDRALRSAIDQHLRPGGFTGSIPHLRRHLAGQIDLISIQHFSASGSFVVEVACSPPAGISTGATRAAADTIRAVDIHHPRPRVGADDFPSGGDHWFVYGPRNYDEVDGGPHDSPEAIASEVIRLLSEQAEPWWRTRPFPRPADEPSSPG